MASVTLNKFQVSITVTVDIFAKDGLQAHDIADQISECLASDLFQSVNAVSVDDAIEFYEGGDKVELIEDLSSKDAFLYSEECTSEPIITVTGETFTLDDSEDGDEIVSECEECVQAAVAESFAAGYDEGFGDGYDQALEDNDIPVEIPEEAELDDADCDACTEDCPRAGGFVPEAAEPQPYQRYYIDPVTHETVDRGPAPSMTVTLNGQPIVVG